MTLRDFLVKITPTAPIIMERENDTPECNWFDAPGRKVWTSVHAMDRGIMANAGNLLEVLHASLLDEQLEGLAKLDDGIWHMLIANTND